jgi:thymidylate synthase
MRRLFRVYAHIYHAHFEQVDTQMRAVEHLNTSFKVFAC